MLIQNGDKLINTRNWSELVRPEQLARDPKSTDMYGKFVCEPLERGFATTIGNSLRRVLLSSLDDNRKPIWANIDEDPVRTAPESGTPQPEPFAVRRGSNNADS